MHDPMCSWCWGYSRVLKQVLAGLPPGIEVVRLLGGLAKDTDKPMSLDMRSNLERTWQRIESEIPGVKFNFDFWRNCSPRRSTYHACRAVIAARQQGAEFDERMTQAIQQAYYQQARNPSDESTLTELANELGLDVARFSDDLNSRLTQDIFQGEIDQVRSFNVNSFPYLLLEHNSELHDIPIVYTDSAPTLKIITKLV